MSGPKDQPFDRRSLLAKTLVVTSGIVLAGPTVDAVGATAFKGKVRQPVDLTNAHVDLTISTIKSPFAVGSIGGTPAIFSGSPYGGGEVRGSMVHSTVEAKIVQQDQVPHASNYLTTTQMSGSLGSNPTTLLGTFTLDSDYLLEEGTVSGSTGHKPVKVQVLPHADTETSSAVAVAGRFGATELSLVAVLPVGGRGSISGTVASKRVHLDVTPLDSDQLTIHLTGSYSGPSDLLALIVGAVSYFGG